MSRVFNFSAGPAMLSESVLQIAKEQMLDWDGSGMSVMEISHRSPAYLELLQQTKTVLRELMSIPDNYEILFMAGGARAQFDAIPMNLLHANDSANYLNSGFWSHDAYQSAKKYAKPHAVLPTDIVDLTDLPPQSSWDIDPNGNYFYYTPNETLLGLEITDVPEVDMPIIADMTSCILSRPYPVEKYGVIFASAQKNMGQAGVTVVIIRKDLLINKQALTPNVLSYSLFAEKQSLFNTMPTYAIYIMNLVLQDLKTKGGVAQIAKINQQKADLLYQFIDSSHFYHNRVAAAYRSVMNVTFSLPNHQLEALFIEQAKQQGLVNLKGHSRIGGVRVSIYNAMPLSGVEQLVQFMQDFCEQNDE